MTGTLVFARLRRLLVLVGLVFAVLPVGSALADTTIGQVGGDSGVVCASGSGQVRADTAYVVPPGGGTITSFSFQLTEGNPGQQLEFLVLRPAGGDSYTVVGKTGLVRLRGSGVETFSANPPIAVQGGDIIGQWTPGALNGCFRVNIHAGDIIHSDINVPDPNAGQMVSLPDVDEAGGDLNESANLSPGLGGPPPPTTKGQCKHGGWRSFGTMFKNQGDCVSFVEHHDHGLQKGSSKAQLDCQSFGGTFTFGPLTEGVFWSCDEWTSANPNDYQTKLQTLSKDCTAPPEPGVLETMASGPGTYDSVCRSA